MLALTTLGAFVRAGVKGVSTERTSRIDDDTKTVKFSEIRAE